MGTIKGDVEVLGISTLLQMLSMNECKGFLTIKDEGQKKVIHFGNAGIRLVDGARRTNPLGEILIRSGMITREQLDELLAEQRRTGNPLGEIVSQRGILEPHVIQSALREQVAEEIYDLFNWTGATFLFKQSADENEIKDGSPLAQIVLDSNVMSIMIEAARRVDELARIRAIIPDVRLVPDRLELPAALDDPSLEADALVDILPLVDGQRSVGHIIEESLYPKFTVLRTLYALAQRGVVKIRDRGDGETKPITVIHRAVEASPASPIPSGRTVLLVSELPTFRDALARCLRGAGFDVIEDATPVELFERLRRQSPDVIVFDVPLETEDGLALCTQLREKTAAPFIVLSGNSSKQAISHALQSGARHVLSKPVRETLLIERLSNVLRGSSE